MSATFRIELVSSTFPAEFVEGATFTDEFVSQIGTFTVEFVIMSATFRIEFVPPTFSA
jgi:hypothetical protein